MCRVPLLGRTVLTMAGLAAAALLAINPTYVWAAEPGLSSARTAMPHPSHAGRVAVLIVAGAPDAPRNRVADADEAAYRKLLQELGFEVLTVGPSTRPELDQALREVARRIPTGGEVAIFVLGTA